MVKFGTDGWRAMIAEEFTFDNVRIVSQAYADYLNAKYEKRPIYVGWDARFMSQKFAQAFAEILAANGLKVYLACEECTTPALSYIIYSSKGGGGAMITASHNSWEYNGIKLKAPEGCSLWPQGIKEVEKYLGKNPVKKYNGIKIGHFSTHAPSPYTESLEKFIDLDYLISIKRPLVIDYMRGSGRKHIDYFLRHKCGLELRTIRDRAQTIGLSPEPIEKNLTLLKRKVVTEKAVAGFATDGDGDRIGAVDSNGKFISAQVLFAIFIKHLIDNKGFSGDIIKTISCTSMVDKLAKTYGRKVKTTPIGFKYVAPYLISGDFTIGGEESGGFGFKGHIPERDGLLSMLYLLEAIAAFGKSLEQIAREIMGEIGEHHYKRVDYKLDGKKKKSLMTYLKGEISEFPETIEKLTIDGVKLVFKDSSWILFRESGTEPIVRVYCEANTLEKVNNLLERARKLIAER